MNLIHTYGLIDICTTQSWSNFLYLPYYYAFWSSMMGCQDDRYK